MFQSEGFDYMKTAIRSINALRKAVNLDPLDQAELMTSAVSMEEAAHLFFIAAKAMDKTVTFEEIQEAVLLEGPLMQIDKIDDKDAVLQSYPVSFANLCMFASLGVVDNAKK